MFTYTERDFIYETSSDNTTVLTESRFDKSLQEKWNAAVDNGYFRYPLKITDWKFLPGNYRFLAQLNTDRATNRRAPQNITSLTQPFDGDKFNFTRVDGREMLFKLRRVDSNEDDLGTVAAYGGDRLDVRSGIAGGGKGSDGGRGGGRDAQEVVGSDSREDSSRCSNVADATTNATGDEVSRSPPVDDGDYLAINVSPLEYCHALLLPDLHGRRPQVADAASLALCVRVLLLSGTRSLRVGFNSLCGNASVNHLHYHVYYLQHAMLLETISVRHLSGPCYELVDYPAHGFVFQLPRDRDTAQLARSVHRLTSFLHERDVAHNVYFTRGTTLDEPCTTLDEPCTTLDEPGTTYATVRVYVWARTSSAGVKESGGFTPALCELFGHLNMKRADLYETTTQESVADILSEICRPVFDALRSSVVELYK